MYPMIANAATVRVTRVDSCGRPVCGPDNAFVTHCFTTVGMEANVEEGTDIEFRAANGQLCGFKPGCPSFRGYNITFSFLGASPELIEIMTGAPVVYGYDGRPIGWDDCSLACRAGFALEVWSEVVGPDVCEDEQGDGSWLYVLLPWVSNGQIGNLEFGAEGVTFSLTGATRNNGRWGVGPYDVMAQDAAGTPGPLLTPLEPECHRRAFVTSIAPPVSSTDYLPVEGELCEVS